jgi:dCMP deaminase
MSPCNSNHESRLHQFFIKTAKNLALESRCVSRKVGALIVQNNRIISMGYNGTPSGIDIECSKVFASDFDRETHHQWSKIHEIHAEMNAILFAAKSGISIDGAVMYVTLHPCDECLKNIMQSGISHVFYLEEYDKATHSNPMKTLMIEKGQITRLQSI